MIINMVETERHIKNYSEDIDVFDVFTAEHPASYQYFVTFTIDNISGETIPTSISVNRVNSSEIVCHSKFGSI